ncbi:MAG: hypothetical protein WC732_08410 [Candidatus Omnitrophota bacterium]
MFAIRLIVLAFAAVVTAHESSCPASNPLPYWRGGSTSAASSIGVAVKYLAVTCADGVGYGYNAEDAAYRADAVFGNATALETYDNITARTVFSVNISTDAMHCIDWSIGDDYNMYAVIITSYTPHYAWDNITNATVELPPPLKPENSIVYRYTPARTHGTRSCVHGGQKPVNVSFCYAHTVSLSFGAVVHRADYETAWALDAAPRTSNFVACRDRVAEKRFTVAVTAARPIPVRRIVEGTLNIRDTWTVGGFPRVAAVDARGVDIELNITNSTSGNYTFGGSLPPDFVPTRVLAEVRTPVGSPVASGVACLDLGPEISTIHGEQYDVKWGQTRDTMDTVASGSIVANATARTVRTRTVARAWPLKPTEYTYIASIGYGTLGGPKVVDQTVKLSVTIAEC